MLAIQWKEIIKEGNKSIVSFKILSEDKKKPVYFAKDNFWTKQFPTTASSNFLVDFQSGNDATVIKLLNKKGYLLLGKSSLDEFASAGTGLLANTGPLTNPFNSQHIPGGSSSGSAIIVAKGLASFTLGTDTGDSIRRPASYCGIIGFKPSYGLISRYGVISMASSLDTIGILAKHLAVIKEVFQIISQPDTNDLLTIVSRKKKSQSIPFVKAKKIAIFEGLEKCFPSQLVKIYQKILDFLKEEGYLIEKINLPRNLRENLQMAYIILFSSELVSHLNSLQGITYGKRIEKAEIIIDIEKKAAYNRSSYLGKNLKQRLLVGSYFLQNPSDIQQARCFRRKTIKWIEKVFKKYNFLIFPSTNSEAPKITDISLFSTGSNHWSDDLMLLANFSGIPSLSLPVGFINGLPVGINLNANYKQDNLLLKLAELLEKKLK